MNLVTSRPARKAALVAATRAGRALVLLPWKGRTLVGTSESSDARQPDDQDAKRGEVDAFLAEVNATFPALGLKADEMTLVHRGIVPAAAANGQLSLLGQSRIIDHAHGRTPAGAHLDRGREVHDGASCRRASGRSRPAKDSAAPASPCRTADTILPGAGMDDRDPADPIRACHSRRNGAHVDRCCGAANGTWRAGLSRGRCRERHRRADAAVARVVRRARQTNELASAISTDFVTR